MTLTVRESEIDQFSPATHEMESCFHFDWADLSGSAVYSLPNVVRAYGLAKLRSSGEFDEACRPHDALSNVTSLQPGLASPICQLCDLSRGNGSRVPQSKRSEFQQLCAPSN